MFCNKLRSFNNSRVKNSLIKLLQISHYSSQHSPVPSKPNHLNVFDRQAKILQRERAANLEDSQVYDYLKNEIAIILADRLNDIKREFSSLLDLGCGKGFLLNHLRKDRIGSIIATDSSPSHIAHIKAPENIPFQKILMDEEFINFKNNTFNIVVSNLNLHWVNLLPVTLRRINEILKPDGVFIGAMFGCQTLYELRCSLQLAELEREGGFGSHISPFAEIRDIGGLLNICGFTMLTIDTQEIKVGFPSIFELMEDLKGMGENNASWKRKIRLNKDTLFAANAIYKEMYGNEDGSFPATFQIIYMIAWKPDPSQPKPLAQQRPEFSFKDLDKLK